MHIKHARGKGRERVSKLRHTEHQLEYQRVPFNLLQERVECNDSFILHFILARSANLPTGLYILLALIPFLFFYDRLEHNYLRIHWTDFRDLCTK